MAAFEHQLSEPIELFQKTYNRVFLMEPRAKHLARFGEPQMPVFNSGNKSSYDVNDEAAIAKYIDDLISLDGKEPVADGRLLFSLLSLADGIAIRDALFGFFIKAKLTLISARSTSSPTT